MAERDSGAANDRPDREPRLATPRRELARLHGMRAERDGGPRERFERAVLIASGELGYRRATVRDVLERSGGSRNQFYREFTGKAECYAAAYERAAGELADALLEAGAAERDWRAGFRAALLELARFAAEQPALARGVVVQVHVAGGRALDKREEVFERLARAIDSARRETAVSRHSPPPITAAFILSTVEQSVAMALLKGQPERFASAVPDLVQLASAIYLGESAGRDERPPGA